jgi:hypothetical protein
MHGFDGVGVPYFEKQSRELTIKNGEFMDAISTYF